MSDLDNFTKAELIATVEELAADVARIEGQRDLLLGNLLFVQCPDLDVSPPECTSRGGADYCKECWLDWLEGNQ